MAAPNTNDQVPKRRPFSYVTVSALAHAGLLAFLLLKPYLSSEQAAKPSASGDGVVVDLADGGLSESDVTTPEAGDVMIAANGEDDVPVALPEVTSTPQPLAQLPEKTETKTETQAQSEPEPTPIFVVKTAPLPVKVEKASPVEQPAAVETKVAEEPLPEPTPAMVATSPAQASEEPSAPAPTPAAEALPATEPSKELTPVEKSAANGEYSGESEQSAQPENSDSEEGSVRSEGDAENSEGSGQGEARHEGIPDDAEIRDASVREPAPSNANPVYPKEDRLNGREGKVVVIARVNTDGSVGAVYLEESSGSKQMDLAAAKAMKSWKYRPGREEYLRKAFSFTLSGEAVPDRARLGN